MASDQHWNGTRAEPGRLSLAMHSTYTTRFRPVRKRPALPRVNALPECAHSGFHLGGHDDEPIKRGILEGVSFP